MVMRYFILGGLTLLVLSAAGFAAWVRSLPPAAAAVKAPHVSQEETDAILAALKPPKRERPLIAVLGINDATETTDYLMPTGILRRADVADVFLLAPNAGPVRLYPALMVEPDATIAEFDARNADGADYVIVPAMSRDDDPEVLAWLQDQARKGAIIIGVCAGAKIVAAAGLLDSKRATTHWYYLHKMLERHSTIQYVPNRRVVIDGRVVTTTGISASMPMSLTLIEAIAGREKAQDVARQLGLLQWDLRHDSAAFKFTRPFALSVIENALAFWRRERVSIDLRPGVDEVSLALVADMWSRTYRSSVTTFSVRAGSLGTHSGLQIVPDEIGARSPSEQPLIMVGGKPPATVLDETLRSIAHRYGTRTADVVAMQLEYPGDWARTHVRQ